MLFAFLTLQIGSRLSKLGKKYKTQFVDYLLSDCTHTFDQNGVVDEGVFLHIDLVDSYDYYRGEDKLTINIPNDDGSDSVVHFEISDVNVKELVPDGDDGYKEVTRYDGCFGFVEFPQDFNCHLTLNLNQWRHSKKMEKVALEDIEFSKEFSVRSSNQIEARYILTPDFMQKLLNLKKKVGRLIIVMTGAMMYIAMPSKKLFSTIVKKEGKNIEESFMRYYDDIQILMSIVKEIQNNNKVFKI